MMNLCVVFSILVLAAVAKCSVVAELGHSIATTTIAAGDDHHRQEQQTQQKQEQENTIVAKLSGFQSDRAQVILQSLLGRPQRSEEIYAEALTVHNMQGLANVSLLATSMHANDSDLSFIFMDHADLMNENIVIDRFQAGFAPLLRSRNRTKTIHANTRAQIGVPMNKTHKRPYIIVYTGTVDTVRQVEFLLKEAWALLDKSTFTTLAHTDRLFDILDVQIILTPHYIPAVTSEGSADDSEYVNPKAVEAVKKALNTIPVTTRSLSDVVAHCVACASMTTTDGTNTNNAIRMPTTVSHSESMGIDAAQIAISEALDYALLSANASLPELNSLYSPVRAFAQYVDTLVQNATAVLRESVVNKSVDPFTVSAVVMRLAEADLASRIYSRLTNVYKHQLQLLKEQVTAHFNHIVTEQIALSPFVLEDLHAARELTLLNFSSCVRQLTPAAAPAVKWNGNFETYELLRSIDEFIVSREEVYRASGVLPRQAGANLAYTKEQWRDKMVAELPPMELSLHVLATQPLVRDYRADPLGARATDKVKLRDAEVSAIAGPKVSAAQARRALKGEVQYLHAQHHTGGNATGGGGVLRNVPRSFFDTLRRLSKRGVIDEVRRQHHLHSTVQHSEFAREMMMLPLSLKNPDVPVSSGLKRRGKGNDRSSTGVGGSERGSFVEGVFEGVLQRRMRTGPERLVRWDVGPMDEVRQNLQRFEKQQEDSLQPNAGGGGLSMDKIADQVLNVLPALKKGHYQHPRINYGPAYSPSPVRGNPGA